MAIALAATSISIAAFATMAGAQYGNVVPSARRVAAGATAAGAGAAITVTAPGASAKVTRLWGFTIACTPATGTVSGQVTVSDGTWTIPYQFVETTAGGVLQEQYPPIDASAGNTAITLTVPAIAGGGTCSAALFYSQQT